MEADGVIVFGPRSGEKIHASPLGPSTPNFEGVPAVRKADPAGRVIPISLRDPVRPSVGRHLQVRISGNVSITHSHGLSSVSRPRVAGQGNADSQILSAPSLHVPEVRLVDHAPALHAPNPIADEGRPHIIEEIQVDNLFGGDAQNLAEQLDACWPGNRDVQLVEQGVHLRALVARLVATSPAVPGPGNGATMVVLERAHACRVTAQLKSRPRGAILAVLVLLGRDDDRLDLDADLLPGVANGK